MPLRLFKYCIVIFILVNACSGKGIRENTNQIADTHNYIKYAERFDIQKKEGYSVLSIINPWQGAVNIIQKYYLLTKGSVIPDGVDSVDIIRVPLEKIICMSTTHLSMISSINEEKTIKGISGADYIYEKKLIDLIAAKGIPDVGYEDNLNKELVIQLAPDLVMVYGIGNESTGYISKLKELGIRILFNADYLETDPLGKAEWIKLFGVLYNKELMADSIFSTVSDEYTSLKTYITENIHSKPSVFLGLPWKDTWFISPGNSYISRLISDAGGDYIWKDTNSEISMPFGIENVYVKAVKAEYWLNPGSVKSQKEITAIDNRLRDLPSFKNGKIFNNIKRITPKGGNDYWGSGSINPQILLKDIASILHPDLFPGYELYFFRIID